MTQGKLTRDSARARLQSARAELSACANEGSEAELEAIQTTPEWSALDLLRHMWIWDELGALCLERWGDGQAWLPRYDDEDRFNVEAVADRSAAGLAEVAAGLRAASERFAATLDSCSEADLDTIDTAPWGDRVTRLQLINELIGHDLDHLAQIRLARRP